MRRDWRLLSGFLLLVAGLGLLVVFYFSVTENLATQNDPWPPLDCGPDPDVVRCFCLACGPAMAHAWTIVGFPLIGVAALIVGYCWWKPKR